MRKRSEVAKLPNPLPEPVLIEDEVCEKCYGPVYKTPSGVLCKQCGGGVETLPMPPKVDRVVAHESSTTTFMVCPKCGVSSLTLNQDSLTCTNGHTVKSSELVTKEAFAKKVVEAVANSTPADTNPVRAVFGSSHELPRGQSFKTSSTDTLALDRIVESVFDCDIDSEFKRLKEELKLGNNRSERGFLQIAIDNAEDNARSAHAMYVTAKLIKEAYEAKADKVIGAMWKSASDVLEQEKKNGLRSKQITDADVRYKAAEMYPDEWSEQTLTLRRYDQTVKHLEQLVQLWNSRCNSVRKLSDLVR